ncbi:DUF4261 domain-containing protein [uncultured Roseibium sp.]|uniref:DUF4261 domain-containing protein n=1 Tax=uncultured Roseibium sp. TaxID=1936171 RepID=UPI00260ABD28|nr:DUF4261 domain-containing protein [uncultured Roseibium sp.]
MIAALKSFAPNVEAETVDSEQAEAAQPTHLVRMGQTVLALIHVDKPLPVDTAERPIAYNQTWPGAKAAVEKHKAHVIVAVFQSEEGFAAARQSAINLTLLTAAVIKSHSVLSIIWTTGNTISEPIMAFKALQQISEQKYPLDLWLQIYPYRPPTLPESQTMIGFVTEGLQPFIGREIQFEPGALSPQDTASRVLNISHYLLAQGPVLRDGETLGISETEKIRIRHRPEGAQPGVPILELSLEQAKTI